MKPNDPQPIAAASQSGGALKPSGGTRQGRHQQTYDYIVIGSGFGGSVSAMRLTEKGYSVLVLEKGKRFEDKDFAKSNWQFWKYLWLPALRAHGNTSRMRGCCNHPKARRSRASAAAGHRWPERPARCQCPRRVLPPSICRRLLTRQDPARRP